MSVLLRDKYRSKFKEIIKNYTRNKYYTELIGEEINFTNIKSVFRFKLSFFIKKYFNCINGFIGHDYLLLQTTVFDVLYFILIEDEKLDEKEEINRRAELNIAFYLFLNCIYNIKEKFLYFIGCVNNNSKLDFSKSILSDKGKTCVSNLFGNIYPVISRYCEARNLLVHNVYDIDVNDKKEIEIILNSFSFRNEIEAGISKKIIFSAEKEEILRVLYSLYELKQKYIEIIFNEENIEDKDIMNRYIDGNTGFMKISV